VNRLRLALAPDLPLNAPGAGVSHGLGQHGEALAQPRGAAAALQRAAAAGAGADGISSHGRSAREHVLEPDRSRLRRGLGRFALAAALLLALDGAPLGEALQPR